MEKEILRRTKTLREKSDKPPGGQPSHEGRTLQKTEIADSIVEEFPKSCTCCGVSLEDNERTPDYVTQVVSLPELKPLFKEVRHYMSVCKYCGVKVRTQASTAYRGYNVRYDASIKTLAVYFSVVQFLPYGRIAGMYSH